MISYIESDYLEELHYAHLPYITPPLFSGVAILLHEKEVRINRVARSRSFFSCFISSRFSGFLFFISLSKYRRERPNNRRYLVRRKFMSDCAVINGRCDLISCFNIFISYPSPYVVPSGTRNTERSESILAFRSPPELAITFQSVNWATVSFSNGVSINSLSPILIFLNPPIG